MNKINHNLTDNRTASIMLQVQTPDVLPILVEIGNSKYQINNVRDAEMFSCGMLAAIEGKDIERDE